MRRAAALALLAGLWVGGCAECESDDDCPGSRICDRRRGQCEALVCARDRDCAPGHRCHDNRCRATPADAGPRPAPDALVITPAR